MEPPSRIHPDRAVRMADGVLMLLLLGATFALGCQELYDSDIWWHVRSGQWIWENRQIPRLDPFTFTSADRPWIDLHWLFQVLLATVYTAGGARGMILMAAGMCAAVLMVSLTARDRREPLWVALACWLPALVLMSARVAPRPELFSLLGMAAYLAVLRRTDSQPALAWTLPLVQVIWVNAHGLFVLGPVILGAYIVDRLAGSMGRRRVVDPQPAIDERAKRRPSVRPQAGSGDPRPTDNPASASAVRTCESPVSQFYNGSSMVVRNARGVKLAGASKEWTARGWRCRRPHLREWGWPRANDDGGRCFW